MQTFTRQALRFMVFFCLTFSFNAQAGLWDDTKEAAASAWEKTKEVSNDAWQATKETGNDVKQGAEQTWNEVTTEKSNSADNQENEGSLSDIKKLGDKETYVKAWEGVKESARNPEEPETDSHGLPK